MLNPHVLYEGFTITVKSKVPLRTSDGIPPMYITPLNSVFAPNANVLRDICPSSTALSSKENCLLYKKGNVIMCCLYE